MSAPDLLYSDVEEELRSAVRAVLADRSPPARVLARTETDEPYDPKLWRTLATELGVAGLAVPESYGGAGASLREAAVVCEELGRGVAPVPFLGSAVVATAALLAAGGSAVAVELLGELAAGTRTAALAVPFPTAPDARVPFATVDSGRLTGTVDAVADALPADVLLVPAADGLYAVDAAAATRTPIISLDQTRQLCVIALDGVPARLVTPDGAAVTAGLRAGAGLLASEQVGVAQWCLESTVDYGKTRYQFARPVGSFQAVKHRLADVWVALTQARAVARYAADCLAKSDVDTAVAVAVAQAHCGPTAVTAAEECVQLHGGIGFTWEHPAHLYLKRAKADAIGFGTADRHRATLARLVDLPAGESS